MIVGFFFQAEDGIRDIGVTGVQTCALPILLLAVVALIGIVLPLVGGWLPLDGRSELVQALGSKAVFFAGAVVMAIVLARTAGSRQAAFVVSGDLRAPSSFRLPGTRRPLSWAVVGPAAAVLLFGLF